MKRFLFLILLLLMTVPATAEMLSVIHQPAQLREQSLVARSKVLSELPRNTPLEVIAQQGEYYKVKDYRGLIGYIHRSLVSNQASVVVTKKACNVRSGPNTEHTIAFYATQGNAFRALSKQGEWIEIADEKGNHGWIWQNLIWGD